jgi:hypothetical protein
MRTENNVGYNAASESPTVFFLADCFDNYAGALTAATATNGTISLSPSISPALPAGNYKLSYLSGQTIVQIDIIVTIATPSALIITGTALPVSSGRPIRFYSNASITPVAFDLLISVADAADTTTVRIEPAPNGTARLELQELLKLFIREPSTPSTNQLDFNNLYKRFYIKFSTLPFFELEKITAGDYIVTVNDMPDGNIYGRQRVAFKDLSNLVLTSTNIEDPYYFNTVPISSLTAGSVSYTDPETGAGFNFMLYNAISCREPVYLSGTYNIELSTTPALIDVSTVVLCYLDQYGAYDYLRFSGNNVPFKAVSDGVTIQRIGTNFDTNTYTEYSNLGDVFEGIDLIAASDVETNYLIDRIEQQRILDALNTSKYVWLIVKNADAESIALPVRVQREIIKYQGALTFEPIVIQASIVLNVPLRQIN